MQSRAFPTAILTLFFLINIDKGLTQTASSEIARKNGDLYSLIKDKLEFKVGQLVSYLTRYLAEFNDEHLGRSEFGRYLYYDDIKPKLEPTSARAGGMKKMAMAMMPLVFHVGATSTWMILTSIMAAKSVMIGLVLLVFKIAVSSAKLASFFTLLKGKDDHHHGWSWSPPQHHEYHGHDRSFSNIEHKAEHHIEHHPSDHHPSDHHSSDIHSSDHHSSDWHSYSPEWTPNDVPTDYHTIPSTYKHADIPLEEEKNEEYNGPYLRAEDRTKKAEKKKFK